MLRIEIDGHFHGATPVKPWVAEITGTDPQYGLAREFIQPMHDWKNARKAWSGNVYGRVAHFPMREGHLYEVSRCRGNPSRRRVVREFVTIAAGKRVAIGALDALAVADGGARSAVLRVNEDNRPHVSRILGLGTPERIGFAVIDGRHVYRLSAGVYEVVESGVSRLVGSDGDSVEDLSQQEAWEWLSRSAG